MTKQLLKDVLGWGFILWFIGYVLGILFFMVVPPNLIGWVIMPIGTLITFWVAFKKLKRTNLPYYIYIIVALGWTFIAIILDYFFLVKAFKPVDGYYKPSVIIYYCLMFFIPILAGWWKRRKVD